MKLCGIYIIVLIVYSVNANLTREQKRRCEQFVSLFENGRFELQYSYVENIHDGMGYTSGRVAFTTSTGDAFEVVRRYTIRVPDNPLARYVSELKLLADRESSDVSNLSGYPTAWKRAARDPLFRQIQDDVSDSLYYRPAMILSDKENVNSALGQCIFYDTVIQHGNGEDLDSIKAILRRTEQIEGGIVDANEERWIKVFLRVRRHIVVLPHDKALQMKWRKYIDRVDILTELVDVANWELSGPIHIDTPDLAATIL